MITHPFLPLLYASALPILTAILPTTAFDLLCSCAPVLLPVSTYLLVRMYHPYCSMGSMGTRCCPLERTFGFLHVPNQGTSWGRLITTTKLFQLTPICALQASRAEGPRQNHNKRTDREIMRANDMHVKVLYVFFWFAVTTTTNPKSQSKAKRVIQCHQMGSLAGSL